MPSTLSFHEAATTPTVFITGKLSVVIVQNCRVEPCSYMQGSWQTFVPAVEMAMEKAAAMAPGDRVLVHAAAGGVGLAAIQVAQVG